MKELGFIVVLNLIVVGARYGHGGDIAEQRQLASELQLEVLQLRGIMSVLSRSSI